MWLAAEHGMFLRLTKGDWMTTMPENLHMDWVDSVKVNVDIKLNAYHPIFIATYIRIMHAC